MNKLGIATLATITGLAGPANADNDPIDVILVMDTSGSTGALLPNWKAAAKAAVGAPTEFLRPGSRFAIVKHEDFPYSPFGAPTDVAYKLVVPFTPFSDWDSVIQPALDGMTSGSGGDTPESQYVAVSLALTGAGMDLDNDGFYTSPGEVDPLDNVIGIDTARACSVWNFTFPDSFHDSDIETGYPELGHANGVTPGRLETIDNLTVNAPHSVKYHMLVTNPLTPSPNGLLGPGEELAAISGGIVAVTGPNLETLAEAVLEILAAEDSCEAIVTNRDAGSNPFAYSAAPAVIGESWLAVVDTTVSGHTFATVLGYLSPLNFTLGGGQVLLVNAADDGGELFNFTAAVGPIAIFSDVVPDDITLCGITVYTQAALVGGVTPFALSNAQDLFIGTE